MCSKRNIFRLLLLIFICCSILPTTKAYCSLEKMKKYAMEACEHLFLQDEARDKRSISYEHNLIDNVDFSTFHNKHHYISRSIYPHGGYLKVGREHFRKLSQAEVYPKYKPKKLHREKKHRYKREHLLTYNNIPYCCYNRCEEDFFC